MNKISTKLFIGFLCMAVLTIGLLWMIQAGFMRNSNQNSRIGTVARSVGAAALKGSAALNLKSLEEDLNISLLLFDESGNLLSGQPGTPMMGMIIRACQSMIPDQADGKAQLVRTMGSRTRYALLGVPVTDGGYLFAAFSLADFDESARILRGQLWLITLLLVLAAVVLAVLLARKFSKPIRAVTSAARDLAAGQLEVALPVQSNDEIGELTSALNDLSIQLQKTENLRKELIANVSHELRAPLTVIRGYAETVRDVTWPDETKRTEQLSLISAEAARLSRVVADILTYSKLQAGVETLTVSTFPVCPVLTDLVRKFDLAAAARQLSIQLNCPEQAVSFDRDKFEQVLTNLLQNAVNHADPGTVIQVRVEPRNKVCRIAVSNSCPDIPLEELPRIWDRYYQAQNVREDLRQGTGLGLAIVRSILEKNQTGYGVDSRGHSTTFWFDTLPVILERRPNGKN